MSKISFTQLRYFEALARLGHFGRAAEDCAISQPALSMQIKELETDLGAPLVERGARQTRLTALGEVFAERARDVLRAVQELEDLPRANKTNLTGRLRIGVIPTLGPYILPALINHLASTYPETDLQPRETVTRNLMDALHEARLDFAIIALPVSEAALTQAHLFDEDFILVRHQNDAAKPVPDTALLGEMRLLLLEEGHCFRDQALSLCKIPAKSSRELIEGSSLSTLVQMVGAGIGLTLLPETAIPLEAGRAPVTLAHLPFPQPKRSIGMVWRKTHPLGEHFRTIADTVRMIAQDQKAVAQQMIPPQQS